MDTRIIHCAAAAIILMGACIRNPVVAAEPAADPLAPVRDALGRTDRVGFSGRYAAWLMTLDKATIGPARAAVAQGIRDGSLPGRHATDAHDLLDRRWADLDPGGFLDACEHREAAYSLDIQRAVLRDLFAKDRAAALKRFQTSPLCDESINARRFLSEIAAMDPPGMLAFCRAQPEWSDVSSGLYYGWCQIDHMAAWRALQAEPNIKRRKDIGRNLLPNLMIEHPDYAADMLRATPQASERAELFSGFSAIKSFRHDQYDVARHWNTPEGWTLLAKNPPSETPPMEWLQTILAKCPADQHVSMILAFFARYKLVIPIEGKPSNPIFDVITSAELQKQLRAAAHRKALAAKPDIPPLPLPDDAAIEAAYWQGRATFNWLVRKHNTSNENWENAIFQRNPRRALEWIATRVEATDRQDSVGTLASVWPVEQLGQETLRLLALDGAGHRDLALAFVRRWLAVDAKAALGALAAQPAARARMIFGQPGVLRNAMEQLNPLTELRPLLEAINDPVARDMAMGVIARGDSPAKAPANVRPDFIAAGRGRESAMLVELAGMPAGMDRDIAINAHCTTLAIRDAGAVLALVKNSQSAHLKAELLCALLLQGGSREAMAEAKALAAGLPAEWKSGELEIAMATREAMDDPLAWWQAHAHEGFESQRNRSGAFTALHAWMFMDFRSAYTAWLATGPDPQLRAFTMPFAEREVVPNVRAGMIPAELLRAGTEDLLSSVLKCWSDHDPEAATRFCLRIDPIARRQKLLRTPFGTWLGKDPTAAVAWAMTLPVGADARGLFQENLDLRSPVGKPMQVWLMDAEHRYPYGISTLQEETQKSAQDIREARTLDFRETRASVAAMVKLDPAAAAAISKDPPEGEKQSAARLGRFDVALAHNDKAEIDRLWREIAVGGNASEQMEAALALAEATKKSAPDSLPGVLAKIPWPDARYAATITALHYTAIDNPKLAHAILAAMPDPHHRDGLARYLAGPDARIGVARRLDLEHIAAMAKAIDERMKRIDALLANDPVAKGKMGKERK